MDLGYEWIGGNSHVVIVGDILDGARIKAKKFFTNMKTNTTKTLQTQSTLSHQYPQVEVKILKFINKINFLFLTCQI